MTAEEKRYREIITQIANEQKLPYTVVDKTYKAFWLFVRTKIQELPLKKDLTKEEFDILHTCINIPSLGKFSCTYQRYLGIKQRFKYIKKLRTNDNKKD